MNEFHVIFDGPPSNESGRFVEVENEHGESIAFGEWEGPDKDGCWHLVYRLRCAIHGTPLVPGHPHDPDFYCPDCLKMQQRLGDCDLLLADTSILSQSRADVARSKNRPYLSQVPSGESRDTHVEIDPEYVARERCPFCNYAGPSPIIADYKQEDVFIIEPLNPVVSGHVLVIPRRHVEHFANHLEITGKVAMVAADYARGRWGTDFNLITSKGAAATQTVRHLHFHLVPRTPGDGLALPWTEEPK